jgi:thiamine-monophosphate kinase
VPLSLAARRVLAGNARLWANVLGGGDDYELLIVLRPRKRAALLAAARLAGVKVTHLGAFARGHGVQLTVAGRSTPIPRAGYVHF